MSKKIKILFVIVILFVILVVAGVTYAWLSWSENVSLTGTSKCFDISYIKGEDISGDLVPVDTPINENIFTYKQGMALSTFSVGMNNDCTTLSDFTLILKNTSVPSEFINGTSSGALKYALIEGSELTIGDDYTLLASGTINSTDDIIVYTDGISTDSSTEYTFFVYVDGNLAFSDALSSNYAGYITVDASQKNSYDISGYLIDSNDDVLSGYTISIDNSVTSVTSQDGEFYLNDVLIGSHTIEIRDSNNNLLTSDSLNVYGSSNSSIGNHTIYIGINDIPCLIILLGSDNSIEDVFWD